MEQQKVMVAAALAAARATRVVAQSIATTRHTSRLINILSHCIPDKPTIVPSRVSRQSRMFHPELIEPSPPILWFWHASISATCHFPDSLQGVVAKVAGRLTSHTNGYSSTAHPKRPLSSQLDVSRYPAH